MSDIKINITQTDTKGAAIGIMNGEKLAEMTYSIAGPELIIVDHTEIDEQLKGQGVGKKLLLEIVKKARSENFKIMPLCPFATSVFAKDPAIRDVLK